MSIETITQEGGVLSDATGASTELSLDDVLLPAKSTIQPTVSIVIPTLNEEAGIEECITNVKQGLVDLQLYGEVVVVDSSTDRTPEIARENGAIVVESPTPGYGAAYQYGFECARGDYIAMGDGDTTYDFTEIPNLIEELHAGDADIAMGSRLEGDIKPGAMPNLHQYVGNPLLTRFLNTFYGTNVSDAHSGLRVMTRDAYEEMTLGSDGMEFASEMIMEAGAKDLEIVERPITYHEREGEATLDSFEDGWRHVRFMLINAPGRLFSFPGAAMGVLGVVVMLLGLSNVSLGSIGFGPHTMVAGGFLVVMGYQVLSLGAFSAAATNPVRKPKDVFTKWVTEKLSLEQGATLGVLVFGGGAAYAALMVGRWIGSGFTALPFLMWDIAAFTAMVVGVQMIFTSFFLGAVGVSE
jgi:hypothetical protein